MTEIPSSTAKEQLVRIDEFLSEPHILIGGLAVQQYHPSRSSSDIDLICDEQTAKELIKKLYPSKDYTQVETNMDDFRPAYILVSRKNNDKTIFFGPKITERDPYQYINWENLKRDAVKFKYKKETLLDNIKVPRIEALAFIKLLSFINRIESAKKKGEQDLFDFIDLSNNTDFRINYLIDLIRNANCADFIKNRLEELTENYPIEIWDQSSLCGVLKLMNFTLFQSSFQTEKIVPDGKFNYVCTTDKSLLFYEKIAHLYDERNTRILYDGHQSIIRSILGLLPKGGSIIDIGCGTGREIAAHFIHHDNISWLGIDGSKKMLDQFRRHTQKAKMDVQVLHEDIATLDWKKVSAADLCMICFTLTSMSSIECINSVKDLVKPGGYLLIADIHPARTNRSPYYDFELANKKWIALKPNPVYPDKIMEYLLQQKFKLYSQKSIADDAEEDFAFISIFRKASADQVLNEVSSLAIKSDFIQEFPSEFTQRLESANELTIVGTHHNSTLTAYYNIFEAKLKLGHSIKFLLINPNGNACKMAAMRFSGKTNPDHEKARIISSLETLSKLKKVAPHLLQIRVIDFLVDYSAYLMDSSTNHGIAFIKQHTFKTSGYSKKPKFIYRKEDVEWFEHLNDEIKNLWDSAEDWIHEK